MNETDMGLLIYYDDRKVRLWTLPNRIGNETITEAHGGSWWRSLEQSYTEAV